MAKGSGAGGTDLRDAVSVKLDQLGLRDKFFSLPEYLLLSEFSFKFGDRHLLIMRYNDWRIRPRSYGTQSYLG